MSVTVSTKSIDNLGFDLGTRPKPKHVVVLVLYYFYEMIWAEILQSNIAVQILT
jgi:hypothetical protein